MTEEIKKAELKAANLEAEDLEKVSGGNDPLFDDGIEKYKVAEPDDLLAAVGTIFN